MFENAKWIWCHEGQAKDTYVEFRTAFEGEKGDEVLLRISAASNYAAYVNGTFVDSGQYSDLPNYKVYDELDISERIVSGQNQLAVVVWYCGVSSFTRPKEQPGLLFEVERNGNITISSNEDVKCRISKRYISGQNQLITWQLGLSFHVDLTQTEDWMTDTGLLDFQASILAKDMPESLYPRPVQKLVIEERQKNDIVSQGVFRYSPEEQTAGAKMQYAAMAFRRVSDTASLIKGDEDDGVYFVIDMLAEISGYLDFDIEVPEECEMEVGWGEHLEDGRCRTDINDRNFAVSFYLKKGRNRYMNPFRRLGCRYIQLFVHTDRVKIHYAGVRATVYPLQKKKYHSGNLLRDRIYEVCQNTLIQCMHEHYEDCPWREQALYTLDSRNQMLCGYYAFSEFEFPRACLKLIAKSARGDGMLPICHSADTEQCIPSFTLFYIVQLTEYYQYSKDTETIRECFPCAKRIMERFKRAIDETGLVPNFDEKEKFWNFYEWQPGLEGYTYKGTSHDMCLNALFSWTIDFYAELCKVMEEDTKEFDAVKQKLNRKMIETFYDVDAKLFRTCDRADVTSYSVLANAWAVLCGATCDVPSDTIMKAVLLNGDIDIYADLIPTTLSMNTFRYEALLKQDTCLYRDQILEEIDKLYLNMLQKGATSFWETEKGDRDFKCAASLCHGWSAMPIYYYELLNLKKVRKDD